jgi:hypothetical protein
MFISWLFGVVLGGAMIGVVAAAVATATPQIVVPVFITAALVIVLAYIIAYLVARMAITATLATFTAVGTGPNPLPDIPTELNTRAFTIGLTAVLNAVGTPALANLIVPGLGVTLTPILLPWAFIVTSLAAIPDVSRDRFFQGVLGWSGWIFPMSLIASVFGFLWFAVNALFALISGLAGGGWPFRIDWSTGAIETVGGITGLFSIPASAAGTVGHFVFVLAPFGTNPATLQQPFVVPAAPAALNVAAHETGHTLDYVAFSGFRMLFALFDQVILGNLFDAYTELTADSHVPNVGRIQVRMWS